MYYTKEEKESADRFIKCVHIDESGFCRKINHSISNGYASIAHCHNCKHFRVKKND